MIRRFCCACHQQRRFNTEDRHKEEISIDPSYSLTIYRCMMLHEQEMRVKRVVIVESMGAELQYDEPVWISQDFKTALGISKSAHYLILGVIIWFQKAIFKYVSSIRWWYYSSIYSYVTIIRRKPCYCAWLIIVV